MRCGGTGSSSGIPNRVCFEARTEAVNRMELFGNWEANTMTGKGHQGAMVNLEGQKFKHQACG